ncbi:hypothetical protein Pen02_01320 [Plantactinospora endophytica]|uniref:4Fe-4S Wbl-type domain-containing protein n=1 Tax=Plantactinospora endophytica TaxID=673535 RepID=A0ABQ4DRW9_9ACTN|nr:hypothetical protein Pen02_01320 [Plantactinospora endophytica]
MTEQAGSGRRPGLVIARTVIAMRRTAGRCWHSRADGTAGCVLLDWAVEGVTRRTLRLAARRIVAEHWPTAADGCPVCGTPDCPAFRTAVAYLDLIGDDYLPLPVRSGDALLVPAVSTVVAVRAADAAVDGSVGSAPE